MKSVFELLTRHRFAKPDEQVGAWLGRGDVPELGFRFAAELRRDFFRRMNLQRKFFVGVEKFDQQREALGERARLACNASPASDFRRLAENLFSMFYPELV